MEIYKASNKPITDCQPNKPYHPKIQLGILVRCYNKKKHNKQSLLYQLLFHYKKIDNREKLI
jgi:hypothetical protein